MLAVLEEDDILEAFAPDSDAIDEVEEFSDAENFEWIALALEVEVVCCEGVVEAEEGSALDDPLGSSSGLDLNFNFAPFELILGEVCALKGRSTREKRTVTLETSQRAGGKARVGLS